MKNGQGGKRDCLMLSDLIGGDIFTVKDVPNKIYMRVYLEDDIDYEAPYINLETGEVLDDFGDIQVMRYNKATVTMNIEPDVNTVKITY
jgi:hypothetical protein